MNNGFGEYDYQIWSQGVVIADCLRKYGLNDMASDLHKQAHDGDKITGYVNLINRIATSYKDNDVLDRLYFAGLIYG